jgi:hypothetical protein
LKINPVGFLGRSRQRDMSTNKLTKEHRRWLKRLVTGRVPDHLWPVGVDARGRLRTLEPGQEPPPIKIISEAEAGERERRPLPLP